jgi:ATP/maltotriose-dependent transcriptional regulator MalT
MALGASEVTAGGPTPDPSGEREAAAEEVACDIVGRAVRDLQDGSPAAAARLLVHALEVLRPAAPRVPELVVQAVGLLAAAGEFDELETLLGGTSAASFSADQRTEITIGVVEALSHHGRDSEVVTQASAALARGSLTSPQRASLLAFQAHARLMASDRADLSEIEDLAAQALAEAKSSQHVPAEVLSLVVSSMVHHARGEFARAVTEAAEAVHRSQDSPAARRLHPELGYARMLFAVDRAGDAERILTEGQETATALGTSWSQPLWHRERAEMLLAQGRIPDALTECEKGLLRVGSPASVLSSLHLLRAWCFAGLGQLDHAEESVAEAERGSAAADRPAAYLDWTRVWLTQAGGDRFRLPLLVRRAARRGLGTPAAPAASQVLAVPIIRTLLASGHRALATELGDQLVGWARNNPGISSRQALACHADGLVRASVASLTDAVEHYRAAGLPGPIPWALADLAVLQAAAGDGDAAAASYRTARRLFTEHANFLGATMADEALRSLRTSRTVAGTDTSSLDALSPAERRVGELVAAGHTNREVASLLVLSPHTVDSHLRHIFAKVGVANRVQLSAAFHAAAATESWTTQPIQVPGPPESPANRPAAAVAGR